MSLGLMDDSFSTTNGSNVSTMKICAVCISRDYETWGIKSIPFCNYTDGWKPFQHEQTKERVAYLADRRNKAVSQSLSLYPDVQHILMIDSYYIHQTEQIKSLVRDYSGLIFSNYPQGCIVGATTWFLDKRRIRPALRFYDGWTTPEGLALEFGKIEKGAGFMHVKAVGGCYVYPRWVWEKTSYDVPHDLHGCEHNWLCEKSGLTVLLSLNERLWRGPVVYSWPKRFRVSLHLGRFLRR